MELHIMQCFATGHFHLSCRFSISKTVSIFIKYLPHTISVFKILSQSLLFSDLEELWRRKSCPAIDGVFQSLTEAPEMWAIPLSLNHLIWVGNTETVTEKQSRVQICDQKFRWGWYTEGFCLNQHFSWERIGRGCRNPAAEGASGR